MLGTPPLWVGVRFEHCSHADLEPRLLAASTLSAGWPGVRWGEDHIPSREKPLCLSEAPPSPAVNCFLTRVSYQVVQGRLGWTA
jgi:hypothetical protein